MPRSRSLNIHLGQGICLETGYVDADHHAVFDKPLADGAGHTFKRICPSGLDAELAVDHLLAAGRLDAAIAQARQEKKTPFLLIDALLQTSRVRLRNGDLNAARAHIVEAAAALPTFDRGDPVDPNEANRNSRYEFIQ